MRKKMREKRICICLLILSLLAVMLTGCSSSTTGQEGSNDSAGGQIPQIEGLTYEKSVDFTYAECLAIYQYEGGYSPEVNNDGKNSDYDYGSYPQARTITLGVNVTF